jgi:hypothetical protein
MILRSADFARAARSYWYHASTNAAIASISALVARGRSAARKTCGMPHRRGNACHQPGKGNGHKILPGAGVDA